jgi:type I restriction enzyme, S subunit
MTPEAFADHFHTLADVPNGIQKLRELILQLAVQGKLVPQNPKDEPASVLLEKIKAKKEKLIREGKIRKSRYPVGEPVDAYPHKIPNAWQWVRMGDIGSIVGGGTPKTGKGDYWTDSKEIPWLTPADMVGQSSRYIKRGRRDITQKGLDGSSAQLMPVGTVLFSSRAPIGYVGIAMNPLSTNQGFKSCISYLKAMAEYIFIFLSKAAPDINAQATGTTFKEVSGKEVALIPFPLPPLTEQKRIVAKVDQLMVLCDDLEARQQKRNESRITLNGSCLNALTAPDGDTVKHAWNRIRENFDLLYDCPENVNALRQSILQLAVQGKLVPQNPKDEPASVLLEKVKTEKEKLVKEGKIKKQKPLPPIDLDEVPYELPMGWEWVALGDICHFKGGCAFKSNSYVPSSGNQVIRLGNVKNNDLLIHQKPVFIPDELAGYSQDFLIGEGDLLITMTGTKAKRDYLFTVLVKKEHLNGPKLFLNQRVGLLRFSSLAVGQTANVFLKSETMLDRIFTRATGTANQGNIGSTALLNELYPLPPLSEQKRIVTKVDRLMALCDDLQAKLTQSQDDAGRLMGAVVNELVAA